MGASTPGLADPKLISARRPVGALHLALQHGGAVAADVRAPVVAFSTQYTANAGDRQQATLEKGDCAFDTLHVQLCRACVQDEELSGTFIPKRSQVNINIFSMHR